jgi:hypothetical protein
VKAVGGQAGLYGLAVAFDNADGLDARRRDQDMYVGAVGDMNAIRRLRRVAAARPRLPYRRAVHAGVKKPDRRPVRRAGSRRLHVRRARARAPSRPDDADEVVPVRAGAR